MLFYRGLQLEIDVKHLKTIDKMDFPSSHHIKIYSLQRALFRVSSRRSCFQVNRRNSNALEKEKCTDKGVCSKINCFLVFVWEKFKLNSRSPSLSSEQQFVLFFVAMISKTGLI